MSSHGSRKSSKSKKLTLTREQKIRRAIRRAYGGHLAGGFVDANFPPADELEFHMTDWLADFDRLRTLYDKPDSFTREQWRDALFQFLIHVPGHLMRAAELTATLHDPFDVIQRKKATPVRIAATRKRKSA